MMNYKETLFFVGKCLTISHEEHNKIIVENQLKSGNVNWDNVVKLSTEHYVFPALYCNLKRAKFLHYLPKELVDYMKHITDLNRERNLQIIKQAKEVNELLIANNITPIFLKGTGNLLEDLYEDIAERMVGDIDFLVSKTYAKQANEILISNNYLSFNKGFNDHRHLPRLLKNNKIAAVEIHKELTIKKYTNEFNYSLIKKDLIHKNQFCFLSYKNQFCLSIIANQINDSGIYFKNIAFRNAYDAFLLSKKTDTLKAVENFDLLFNSLTNFIALSNYTFGEINSLKFKPSKETDAFLTFNTKALNNSSFRRNHLKRSTKYLSLKTKLNIIVRSIYKKEYRIWLFKRLIRGRQN